MGRFKGPDAEESVACNLIPMIDIMFLLLLFFMLGADMSARERADLELPKADQVQEDDKTITEGESITTVNLQHTAPGCANYGGSAICRESGHWMYTVRSVDYTLQTLETELASLAKLDPDPDSPPGAKPLSARKILIRADHMAPYGDVQKLIEVCAKVGLYKIEVAAARPSLQ